MHQVSWLNNKILYTIINCAVKCLLNIINTLAITSLYMIDDDLCCKCTSYRPVWICFLQCILNSLYISSTAVIKGSTKAYNKNLIFTNLITISRIILRSIACISSEVIRISVLTLNKLLLCVSQCVPRFLCFLTLLIGLIGSLLNINCINQICNLVCCFLIC